MGMVVGKGLEDETGGKMVYIRADWWSEEGI